MSLMPKKGFSIDDDERLVEYVRNYRVLYDHQEKDFRNNITKHDVWIKIGDEIGKSAEQCKKRWKDIRDNYLKILRKEKLPTGSSAPSSSKKWPLFERLDFLNNVSRVRSSFCNISQESIDTDTTLYEEEERDMQSQIHSAITDNNDSMSGMIEYDIPSTSSSLNKFRLKSGKRIQWEEMDKRSPKRLALLESLVSKKENDDDVDLFMKSIAISVKKLPPQLISRAKLEILSCVSRLEEHASQEMLPN